MAAVVQIPNVNTIRTEKMILNTLAVVDSFIFPSLNIGRPGPKITENSITEYKKTKLCKALYLESTTLNNIKYYCFGVWKLWAEVGGQNGHLIHLEWLLYEEESHYHRRIRIYSIGSRSFHLPYERI